MNVGFIGLGNMGAGMAKNLAAAGHSLVLFNRTRAKAESLQLPGAQIVASPAEAARNVEAIFTMLADDAAVSDVVFGKEGLLSTLPQGAIHLSSSTMSTALSRKLAAEHSSRGQLYVGSPVFGRPDAAEAKKLIVMLAGEQNAMARCRPLADAIGRQTFVTGSEPWQAHAVKIAGNFMLMSMVEAFGEAFALMRKSGIEEKSFYDVMSELFASPVYKNYGSIIVERRFDPAGFPLKLGFKDTRLALETALETDTPLPLASLIRDQYLNAMAHGQEALDWASLALVSARNAGLPEDPPASSKNAK